MGVGRRVSVGAGSVGGTVFVGVLGFSVGSVVAVAGAFVGVAVNCSIISMVLVGVTSAVRLGAVRYIINASP